MDEKVLVLLLRRDPDNLTTEERIAFERAFPGRSVEYRRVDSRDYLEHANLCGRLRPAVVLLPRDRPIPSLAMERGFPHVTITSDGKLIELQPLEPQFKPYTGPSALQSHKDQEIVDQ